MSLVSVWRPEAFQGARRKRRYFEGWYYKLINEGRSKAIAVIPGIAFGEAPEDAHSFIQFIDATEGTVRYFRFPASLFKASNSELDVSIGINRFTRKGLYLDIDSDGESLRADLSFKDAVHFPARFPFPGIMGPFALVPWMECYHGVVNLRHRIEGSLSFMGKATDFTGGEGYIEKDWGRSFPDAWIWMQANHFEDPEASFMFSLASIPWMGRHFPGLVCFLLVKGSLHLFATYNRAKVSELAVGGNSIRATVVKPGSRLELSASYKQAGVLMAPKNGMMDRQIKESIAADISVRLTGSGGRLIFESSSGSAGLEICGDLGKYVSLKRSDDRKDEPI